MNYYLGIDIGGTGIKIGVADENGELLKKKSIPTRTADGSEAIIADIVSACKEYIDEYSPVSVGVGCPGDKDDANVSILSAGNLPFRNFPIVEKIESAFSLPVYLENDGQCALIGEWIAGSGKGLNDMVIVTIGTGIGGGCIVNGQPMRGLNNDAGELGHFVIDPAGEECSCGQKGCFEKFASATALIKLTTKAVKENPSSILASVAENGIDGRTVFIAAEKGCEIAKSVLDEYGKRLATGINGLMMIFAPEILTLAGGLTKEGDGLMKFVEPYIIFKDRVKISVLQSDAGLIGASLLHRFADYYLSLRSN